MNKRITRNDIQEDIRLSIRYCALQYALYFYDRIGYNAGECGWNYDYYSVGGIAILTGYRTTGTKGKKVDYDKVEAINRKGEEIKKRGEIAGEDWITLRDRAQSILTPMIQELAKETK